MPKNKYGDNYFYWLCSYVGISEATAPKMMTLARDLHAVPFTWFVPNDDNRAADGVSLRETYIVEVDPDYQPSTEPASVLEVLIGLAIRIDAILSEFDTPNRVSNWYFKMIGNLHLKGYNEDSMSNREIDFIRKENAERIDVFLNRRYEKDGSSGGLFPIKNIGKDQRKVEIWYQMMTFLNENYNY
jgi:hypothetical protein